MTIGGEREAQARQGGTNDINQGDEAIGKPEEIKKITLNLTLFQKFEIDYRQL